MGYKIPPWGKGLNAVGTCLLFMLIKCLAFYVSSDLQKWELLFGPSWFEVAFIFWYWYFSNWMHCFPNWSSRISDSDICHNFPQWPWRILDSDMCPIGGIVLHNGQVEYQNLISVQYVAQFSTMVRNCGMSDLDVFPRSRILLHNGQVKYQTPWYIFVQ